MDTIKTDKMDIRIKCIGIKKRQRTRKTHTFTLIKNLPYTETDLNQYVDRAFSKLTLEMREWNYADIAVMPWTEVTYVNEGYSMKEITMCDPRFKKFELK